MSTPQSRVMSRSSVTGGLEWVRALYRAPKSRITPSVVPKPGRAYYNSVPVVQILAAAFTVVALRCRAVGSLVLTARERLGSPNGDGKAECVVITVRKAATRRRFDRASGGTSSVIRAVGVYPEISSRITDRGRSPLRPKSGMTIDDCSTIGASRGSSTRPAICKAENQSLCRRTVSRCRSSGAGSESKVNSSDISHSATVPH